MGVEQEEQIFVTNRAEIHGTYYPANAVMAHRMLLGDIPQFFETKKIIQIKTKWFLFGQTCDCRICTQLSGFI